MIQVIFWAYNQKMATIIIVPTADYERLGPSYSISIASFNITTTILYHLS